MSDHDLRSFSRRAGAWVARNRREDTRIRNRPVLSPAPERRRRRRRRRKEDARSRPRARFINLISLLLSPSCFLVRVPQAKNKVSKVTAKRKQHETRVKILALRRMLLPLPLLLLLLLPPYARGTVRSLRKKGETEKEEEEEEERW